MTNTNVYAQAALKAAAQALATMRKSAQVNTTSMAVAK